MLDRAATYQALAEILSRRTLSTEERIHELLTLGNELFGTELAIFNRIDGERSILRHVVAPEGSPYRVGVEISLKDTYCFHALAAGGPLAIDHMTRSPWNGQPCHLLHGFESYIGAPVHVGGQLYGALHFSNAEPRPEPFGELELDVIRLLSEWVSSMVEGERVRQALERSEERYRDLVENSLDLIATHDMEGRLLSANAALVSAYGAESADQVVGRNLVELLRPASRHKLSDYLALVEREGTTQGYMTVIDRGGRERLLEYRNTLRRGKAGDLQVRVTARDVTDLHSAQMRLQQSEARMRLFVRYAPAAVAMFDRDMRYLAVSDRWLREFGLQRREVVGRLHDELFPEQADHWLAVRERCLAGEHLADEDPFPKKDGSGLDWIRWEVHPWVDPVVPADPVEVASDPESSGAERYEIGGLMMYIEVITDRKQVEDAWRYMATHDHLTGLLNRNSFLERLERSVSRLVHQDGGGYCFAVFFLDLDGFKAVNDSHGHAVGDRLLKRVAERLTGQLRPKDALARIAGDEFVALLEDVRPEEVLEIADRVTASVRRPYHVEGRVLGVAASLGVALSRPGVGAEELLDEADGAMYVAKERGEGAPAFLLASPSACRDTG